MLDRDLALRRALERVGEREHARPRAGADVEAARIELLLAGQLARRREPRRAGDIADEDIVARLLAVAEDGQWLPVEDPPAEDRDDPGFAVGVLPRTVDVAV